MPNDIIAKRAEARAAISLLEPEIIELEKELMTENLSENDFNVQL